MARTIDIEELLQWRLTAQCIATQNVAPDIPAVVHRLLAIQAQDFGQAVWALGLRAPASRRDDVNKALALGQVVRSWPMRGTLHFVAPEDLRWMLSLTATRTLAAAVARQRQLGLDQAAFDRARDVATATLSGGGALSRNEFTAQLEQAGVSTVGQRGYHIIWYLAQTGVLCWGPPEGAGQALVLLDEWAPPAHEMGREEALREFALRYFIGHGPATLDDFAWWSKLTLTDARAGLAAARDDLTEFDFRGVALWARNSSDTAPAVPPDSSVHALPGFDEYLLGYRDRSSVVSPEHLHRIVPGGNGVFLPIIVVRGRIIGTWRRAVDARGVMIRPDPFDPFSEPEKGSFARAAQAYARFLGAALRLGEAADSGTSSRASGPDN